MNKLKKFSWQHSFSNVFSWQKSCSIFNGSIFLKVQITISQYSVGSDNLASKRGHNVYLNELEMGFGSVWKCWHKWWPVAFWHQANAWVNATSPLTLNVWLKCSAVPQFTIWKICQWCYVFQVYWHNMRRYGADNQHWCYPIHFVKRYNFKDFSKTENCNFDKTRYCWKSSGDSIILTAVRSDCACTYIMPAHLNDA